MKNSNSRVNIYSLITEVKKVALQSMYFFSERTDNLDGAVLMSLADVTCSEPLSAVLLEEILLRFI